MRCHSDRVEYLESELRKLRRLQALVESEVLGNGDAFNDPEAVRRALQDLLVAQRWGRIWKALARHYRWANEVEIREPPLSAE